MKVIFLDVDGVINSTHDYFTTDLTTASCSARLDLIRFIVNNTPGNVQVCISSSWRVIPRLRDHLIDELNNRYITICGYTKYDDNTRGKQIENWLKTNSDKDITNYVVIDDETADMGNLPQGNIIKTDEDTGLTDTDAELAIHILSE